MNHSRSQLSSVRPTLALRKGDIIITVLIFSAIALTITIGLVNWGVTLLKSIKTVSEREQALQIAEAGIDYYRWHLAHASNDFRDGTGQAGPYTHQFLDKDDNILGSYQLTITPPVVGSTVVTIVSKGTIASTTISRSIKAVMAIPSLAKYATVANDNMRFGDGTVVFGPLHSNKGIHFDGIAHNLVSSAMATYTDPDYGATRWAVYTQSGTDDPNPPTDFPDRPDVFMAGRQISVPSVDFAGLTANLSQLKTLATTSGIYLSASQYGGHAALGYHIVLKANDTFDLYVIRSLQTPGSSCSSDGTSQSQVQWGLWSISTPLSNSSNQAFVANYPIPANGIIFVEDNVWVDGQIDTARVTIIAGKLPDPGVAFDPNITVNSSLLYTHFDGTDSIGLIAQGNVNVGYDSLDTQTIDAALVAQNGRAGRYYYNNYCGSSYLRSTLNLYGMIATNIRYGFAYTDNTGYDSRNITYDSNLLYSPPPSFPLTSSFYSTQSWQEVAP
ncbi:MAG: hypothetical protein NTZ38_01115 [Candidatus Taylorbacteria bacterium]|nr:hypothetical protein [Candidatus Taylorbacteria bacterium]